MKKYHRKRVYEMGSRGRVTYKYKRDLQLTEEDTQHVLERHNSKSIFRNKTKFPEKWSDDEIIEAIEETLNFPDRVKLPTPPNDRYQLEKLIDGVTVRVSYYYEIGIAVFHSAYPLPDEVK
jgi:hypothetical protein